MKNLESENKFDRRYAKTHKSIKSAFVEIITQKNISKITIKEIADKADINRKTFYAHYTDTHAILDEIENDILTKLWNTLESQDVLKIIYDPYPFFMELTKIISDDMDFYKHLAFSTSKSRLFEKIKLMLEDKLLHVLLPVIDIDSFALSYIIEFISSGIISSYEKWFLSGRNESLEEISKILSMLALGSLSDISKRKK